jgi:hypothetical protein
MGEVGLVGRWDRGGHHEYDRPSGLAQGGQEELGEVVAAEVVDREERVEPVGRAALLEGEHAGGVDEGVDAVVPGEDALGGIADTAVGGQVGGEEGGPVGGGAEGGESGLALARVTAQQDEPVAVGQEAAGGLEADAAVAAGDEDGLHDAPGEKREKTGGRRPVASRLWASRPRCAEVRRR